MVQITDGGADENGNRPKKNGVLASFVKSISVNVMGTNALTREDIQQALDDMKKKLMERNVAEEIAAKWVLYCEPCCCSAVDAVGSHLCISFVRTMQML